MVKFISATDFKKMKANSNTIESKIKNALVESIDLVLENKGAKIGTVSAIDGIPYFSLIYGKYRFCAFELTKDNLSDVKKDILNGNFDSEIEKYKNSSEYKSLTKRFKK